MMPKMKRAVRFECDDHDHSPATQRGWGVACSGAAPSLICLVSLKQPSHEDQGRRNVSADPSPLADQPLDEAELVARLVTSGLKAYPGACVPNGLYWQCEEAEIHF